jgi:hypothetical protein
MRAYGRPVGRTDVGVAVETMAVRAGQVTELPVAVRLEGRLAHEVTAYVEREIGWQRVPEDGPPLPRLLLSAAPDSRLPSIVVLPAPADPESVRRALLAGALDVVAWPEQRERLAPCEARLPAGPPPAPAPPVVRVGGLSGGVGASTVALTLAGLLAWSGRRTVALGGRGLLELAGLARWEGPGAEELSLLPALEAARELPRVARPVPALPDLWLLSAAGVLPTRDGWPVHAVVADVGVVEGPPWPVDLIVARPDAALRRAADVPLPVLLVGDGALAAAAPRLLGRVPVGHLPWSARVARAGASGRVPLGLPGSFVAAARRAFGAVR